MERRSGYNRILMYGYDCHDWRNLLHWFPMLSLRKIYLRCLPVSWLAIIAMIMLTLAPHHYHLHHGPASDSVSHGHTIDLHLLTDANGDAHHDEAVVLETMPDGLTKTPGDNPLYFLLSVFLLVSLPIVEARIKHPLHQIATRTNQAFHHLTPPLRAPPRQ